MKSPYTQDIGQYAKSIVDPDLPLVDEILEKAKDYKVFRGETLKENLELLEESKTYDVVKAKNNLRDLNQVDTINQDIQNRFKGNVNNWAMFKAREALNNDIYSTFGVTDIENNKLDKIYPDVSQNEIIQTRATNIANKWKDLKGSVDSAGFEYKDIDAGEAQINDINQNIFNQLSSQNNFKLIKSLKSLYKGQGFDLSSPESLKAQYDKKISNSKFSDLEGINNKLKALYTLDPTLATEYEKIVNKADVRKGVKVITEVEDKVITLPSGQTETQKVIQTTTSWTDKLGDLQTSYTETNATKAEADEIKLGSVERDEIFMSRLNTEGQIKYFQLRNGADKFLPQQAFNKVESEFKLTYQQYSAQDVILSQTGVVQAAFEKYQTANYYKPRTSEFAPLFLKDEVSNYLETGKNKPNYYYDNLNSFVAKEFFPEQKTSTTLNEGQSTFNVGLSDTLEWQNYLNTPEAAKFVNDLKDDILKNKEDELRAEFESGDFTRVNANGIYSDKTDPTVFPTDILLMNGMSDLPENINVEAVFNFKTNQIEMPELLNIKGLSNKTPVFNEEGEDTGSFLGAINEIPVVGSVTEFLLGDELNKTDLLWLVPGTVAVKVGVKGIGMLGAAAKNKILMPSIRQAQIKAGQIATKITGKVGRNSSGQMQSNLQRGQEVTGFLIGKTKTGKVVRFSTAGAIVTPTDPKEDN